MEIVETVKQKREKLMEQFNSLQDKRVELEKQIKVVDQDILTFRGAILACNELIEENEQESEDEPVKVVDLDKEKDGG
jgi:predicted  nucleic acid-binding Zn-ribbon protein|tara:strand:+ start:19 stop:252 length:234 start_codon:yes stop_codon:yes gene_type:complete